LQEELEQKTVAITIKATKLTGRMLAKAIAAVARQMQKPPRGKQTVKQLARQNAGMTNIEITDGNIKSFERVARKYGVDFALKKDNGSPPRWLVFFKAQDTDALTAAFTEFSRDTLKRAERPSVRETMRKFRELIKTAVIDRPKEKQRERGGPEL